MNMLTPPLPKQTERVTWHHLHGASLALALSSAIESADVPILIIVKDNLIASTLAEEMSFFCTDKNLITYFPDWETLPYDHFSPHEDIISERLSVLSQLPLKKKGVVITTINTLMLPVPPADFILQHSLSIKLGESLNLVAFRERLVQAGYHMVSQVREHGDVAIRGSIIDLYPMGSHHPFRLDLLDNEIDCIRTFSPDTQRSLEKMDSIKLLPAREFPLTEESIEQWRSAFRKIFKGNPLHVPLYQDISDGLCPPGIEYYLSLFFPATTTLFDYLPRDAIIAKVGNIEMKGQEVWQDIAKRYEQNSSDITRPLLPPTLVFTTLDKINAQINTHAVIDVNNDILLPNNDLKRNHFDFQTKKNPVFDISHKSVHPLSTLQTHLSQTQERTLFTAESLGRREIILALFKTINLHPVFFASWQDFLNSTEPLGIAIANIEEGFVLNSPKLALIPEAELYGQRVMQRRLRKKGKIDQDNLLRDLTELQINDPIVHIDHGIGTYRGLCTLEIGGEIGEFLTIEYQDQDKLYVPVSSLHLINRYTGTNPEHIPINKLGGEAWNKAKKRAAEKVKDVAAELLELYAHRASRPGNAFHLPEDQYALFAASFPFEETEDQLTAIEQVFKDLTSTKPMDRVICGDVGFGKTEVAMRAAFLAVQNNKQVVILAPTTLLAQQHYESFRNRFADWPIEIDVLSRFRTDKEIKNILNRLSEGKIDIVIGTHKLLQDNIHFKSLGLIVIDEEHRFGVKQKERMKALRVSVDILTLSATPIPRTLNAALSGIRDLSLIATPPEKRLSVKTFVHEYHSAIIQEAISRELLRGGQVYFLHNDVSTIHHKFEEIKKLVPESRPAMAHGQMHERELEKIMSDFYHRRTNVLVCSTIIESGIDIPTANTIVINRADKLGLAQLHQLRGRVGRSHHQAYAYLLTPPAKSLTKDAVKRLDAIVTFDELGIGFTIATHDLEIRGAGELLGVEQSGNMHEIGFTLYMDLLSRAVDTLKQGKEFDSEQSLLQHHTEIDLHISALIPEDYLNDVELRLQFYKKIANARNIQELDQIQIEMIDRFGLLPQPIKNLVAIASLKQRADEIGIKKIEASDNAGRFEFTDQPNIKPEKLITLIQTKSKQFRFDGPKRLRFTLTSHDRIERVTMVHAIIDELVT